MRVRERKFVKLDWIILCYIYNLENIRAQAGEVKRVGKTKKSKIQFGFAAE